jgi:Asp-tRNA(Asn)/Glu-tRNA(Gln) amidotransferase B subunit
LFFLGVTTVYWTASDASGNVSTAEQKVTVEPGTPLNQLSNLVKLINYSVASGGIAPEMQTSLLAKINAAIAALVQGNPNATKTAMQELKAFINQIEAQTDKKITPPVAEEIIVRANRIIVALGG